MSDDADNGAPERRPGGVDRLWTPWRMRYVGGQAAEAGCLFCNRLAESDDVRSLILHRGERAFAMMNLFPYNTGHLMLAPAAHVATPEEAEPAALAEVATLLAPVTRALRRVLRCDGFNVGMNVGAVAGAGVADHLHQHVVPRWEGDANFMPILASTMVLPELIPVTYAKARAELARESGAAAATLVVLDADRRRVLAPGGDGGRRLPEVGPKAGEPVWRAAVRTATELTGAPAEVVGWAGERRVVPGERPALTVAVSARAADSDRALWLPLEAAMAGSDNGRDHRTVAAALANLAPGDGG